MIMISLLILAILIAGVSSFSLFNARNHVSKGLSSMNCFAPKRRDLLDGFISTITSCALISVSSPNQAVADVTPTPKRKDLPEEYRQGTAALADSDDTAIVPKEAYIKLDSGVVYADLRVGNGEVVKEGSRVNMQWVLRRSNGYFVDSSETQGGVPFIFTVGDKKNVIAGVDEGVLGMKSGGVRRLLIPPSLAYVEGLDDGKPGPLPNGFGPRQQMRRVQNVRKDVPGEYVFLEVQVTRVR